MKSKNNQEWKSYTILLNLIESPLFQRSLFHTNFYMCICYIYVDMTGCVCECVALSSCLSMPSCLIHPDKEVKKKLIKWKKAIASNSLSVKLKSCNELSRRNR